MDRGEVVIIETLWIVVMSAGFVVFAMYGLDRYLELEKRDVEAGQREQLSSDMLRDKSDASK